MKYQYNFSKWLELIAVKVSSLDELYEMSIAAFETLETNLKKENDKCKESMSLPPLAKPSRAKGKVQCKAAKNNKKRCDNSTSNSNELCNIHQNRDALDWDDEEDQRDKSGSVKGKKKAVEEVLKEEMIDEEHFNDEQIQMPRLKRESNGLIYWPDTIYVVKSFEEVFVIGREDRNGKLQPLEQDDVEYLEQSKIPYKVMNLEFTGENRPPKDVLNAELRKLMQDFL